MFKCKNGTSVYLLICADDAIVIFQKRKHFLHVENDIHVSHVNVFSVVFVIFC